MKIKLFGDGANLEDMVNSYKKGIVTGLTTNPTLMKKSGITDYEKFAKEVLKQITDIPISFEVFSDDFENMEREALIINSWGNNVNIKIPIMNTKGESTIPLIKKLLEQGLHVNATAILDMSQIIELKKIIKNEHKIIISIFAGRIADTGRDPIPTIKKAVKIFKGMHNVEILWASTREFLNIIQAEKSGAHIITCQNDILKKITMMNMDLKKLSLETVKMFYNDAKLSNYKI